MGRSIYRVLPDDERAGNWKLEHEGRVLSSHKTKEEAVGSGHRLALEHQPSQLVIHTRDGKVETEHTYQSDPFPPRG